MALICKRDVGLNWVVTWQWLRLSLVSHLLPNVASAGLSGVFCRVHNAPALLRRLAADRLPSVPVQIRSHLIRLSDKPLHRALWHSCLQTPPMHFRLPLPAITTM